MKRIKNKIMNLFIIFIAISIFAISNSIAIDCNGTLSHPNPVNLGENFTISFFNAMPGWEGTALLNWTPDGLINLTENPTNTTPFNVSKWIMNSTKPGLYNITVIVTNNSNQTCTKNSSILVVNPGSPYLLMNIIMPSLNMITAKSKVNFSVNVTNIGNYTAENVITYFVIQSYLNIEPPSKYLGNIENGSSRIDNYTLTPFKCGKNLTIEGITKYNEYYFVKDSETFDVYGSDLVIENLIIYNNVVYEGDIVKFNVFVKNVNRSNIINAKNAIVKIYRGNNVIKTINFGEVGVGETKNKTVEWEAEGVGTFTPIAKINSDNECSNWNNNEYNGTSITIKKKEVGGGGGGRGGGEGEEERKEEKRYVCGNGICEVDLGENSTNCPEDCLIIPKPIPEYIEISSDDGLVILKLNKRTVIKDKEGNRINASEIKIEKIKDIQLIPSLPEGLYLIRAYKFSPEVSFDIPAQITFKYNEEIPEDANLFIYRFVGDWEKIEAVWDKENKKLISEIYGTSIYALFTDKKFMPQITGAVIGIGEWIKTNWWIIAILGLIIIVLMILLIIYKKRKQK